MKTCSQCREHKTLDLFANDKSKPDGRKYACKACTSAAMKAKRAAGYVGQRDASRRYREANRERYNALQADWREKNRQRVREIDRKHYAANVTKRVVKARKREGDELQATPAWADHVLILEVYELAAEFRAAGFDVHVDHIVPLRGKTVRGLHVHHNLRVCLASANLVKSNVLNECLL